MRRCCSRVLAGTADAPGAPAASLAGARIGVLGGWFAAVLAADVAAAFDAAVGELRALGAELVVVDIEAPATVRR